MSKVHHLSASRQDIEEAKRRLPLPRLMEKIGDGKHAKKSALCPFHTENNASFSVFQKNGVWLWKCHAGCGNGDGVTYLEKRFALSTRDAITRYCREAALPGPAQTGAGGGKAFDWPRCVSALSAKVKRELADWRGYSSGFVDWLHREMIVGFHAGDFAFAVHKAGRVAGCHYLADRAMKIWLFHPKGNGTQPLIFGNPASAVKVLCFESQWDAFAVMDKFSWHTGQPNDSAVLITRGAANGKLIKGQCSPDAGVYAFVQNDGAAEKWLTAIAACARCKVLRVATPAPHKDANDWTRAGAGKAEIEIAIREAKPVAAPDDGLQAALADAAPDFGGVTAWIRGEILDSMQDDDTPASVKNSENANNVVRALSLVGRFYFHADLRDFDSAMFFDSNRKRLERIRSDAFSSWLAEWLHVNRATGLFKFILSAVETAALSGPHTTGILPESFWAARPGAFYLSNGDGSAARITASGVQIVDNGSDGVLFAAGRTCLPWKWTQPRDIFETCAIFRNAHTTAGHAPDLLRVWIYSLPTNPPCKPPLCLAGEVGSGKTRQAKAIAEFYGVPFVAAKVEEKEESNFWPCCDAGGIYTLDNADTKCRWLPDALANAATDGCSERRKLYTNRETVILRARAWLCVTTANPTFAADSGLADRLLLLRMARRDEETSDAALTAEILGNRDAGLSHVAAILQKALADNGPTPGGLNSRHPDFGAFAVRIGRALGREAEMIAALKSAEADKSAFCLENDSIGAALLAYLANSGNFTGTAAELAPKLQEMDAELKDNLSPKRLGKRLSALWPHLKKSLAEARKETNRNAVTVFTFKADGAGFAGFQTHFSQNS